MFFFLSLCVVKVSSRPARMNAGVTGNCQKGFYLLPTNIYYVITDILLFGGLQPCTVMQTGCQCYHASNYRDGSTAMGSWMRKWGNCRSLGAFYFLLTHKVVYSPVFRSIEYLDNKRHPDFGLACHVGVSMLHLPLRHNLAALHLPSDRVQFSRIYLNWRYSTSLQQSSFCPAWPKSFDANEGCRLLMVSRLE